ncbi:MAG: zeta toxin family protein [Candidatus Accumulibacter sp.]|jgi:predicted ABC-type ATPase|nr:zeta toxin family protein [Accumulibacter sp.]
MALNPDEYRLGEAEHQAIFEQRILPRLFGDAKPTGAPTIVILGGQPGAGKSGLIDAALDELAPRGGATAIVGDDLRAYHPRYRALLENDDKTAAFHTDRDSGRWVEKALDEARRRRVNVVVEGTMRNGEVVARTAASFRAAGYTVEARVLAVHSRWSELGILLRYEKQKAVRGHGRMTTAEAHRAAYEGMLSTLERIESEKLADILRLHRRGGETIYSNTLVDGQWAREPQARSVTETERARPMSLKERREYVQAVDELAERINKPERRASAGEIRKADALRRQAKALMAGAVLVKAGPQEKQQRQD